MPVRNFPFLTPWDHATPNVWLPIRVINPETNEQVSTFGLIDTGADDCVVPGFIAEAIGHNIALGSSIIHNTAGGSAISYKHQIRIDICDLQDQCLYTINPCPVDVMNGCPCVLLGVNKFLSHFELHIDYPRKLFSVTHPLQ
jgi:hypothetical protein